jgi:RNA polymerase sigma-70 factor (ECF subfamily)
MGNVKDTQIGRSSGFAATRWSLSAARRAMGELAGQYWFPLYAFLRRKGNSPTAAEDLVQGFFTRVLEKSSLLSVDRAKGKFRSFLLASLKNYLANESDKNRAAKRGGGNAVLSLDGLDAEARYTAEPVDEMTPERVFERRWALAVLELVLARLKDEYGARGQGNIFSALEGVLAGGAGAGYAEIAERLKMTEDAVKVAAHRMRRRYRQLLRDEIAQTVADPDQIDEEIRALLGYL